MRNILLALLLANILYFMYELYVQDDEGVGIAVVNEADLGPPLDVTEPSVPDRQADAMSADGTPNPMPAGGDDAAADEGGPADGEPGAEEPTAVASAVADEAAPARTELKAQVGRSCVTVGPFTVATEAETAMNEFREDGMQASQRNTEAPVFVGHWVQIRDVPDRAAGNAMIATLKNGGLGDAYLVETDDEGLKISLGLFGEMARAERIELQAKSLDLPADITPRTRNAAVVFVDVGLPPGRGAGNIVERYGEGRVLLRDAATCPSR